MVDTTRIVSYLRDIGVLNGDPRFKDIRTEMRSVDLRGTWDEYYMVYPYWQNVSFDYHKEEFEDIDSGLTRLDFDTVQQKALDQIPDSRDTVIVELGSGYGANGTGYLAQHKPNTRVMLVDSGWHEERPFEYLFMPHKKLKHVLRFTNRVLESNLEKRVNRLYHLNGITNVEFHKQELTPENINRFFSDIKGKDIYLFAHRAPKTLPFITGKMYNDFNARYMCVSLTGQEKTDPNEFSWKIIQKNLSLTDDELRGFISSTYDPTPDEVDYYRYDYANYAEERVGVMIKLAIASALAKEVDGRVLRDRNPEFRKGKAGYNQRDHYVEASRT